MAIFSITRLFKVSSQDIIASIMAPIVWSRSGILLQSNYFTVLPMEIGVLLK